MPPFAVVCPYLATPACLCRLAVRLFFPARYPSCLLPHRLSRVNASSTFISKASLRHKSLCGCPSPQAPSAACSSNGGNNLLILAWSPTSTAAAARLAPTASPCSSLVVLCAASSRAGGRAAFASICSRATPKSWSRPRAPCSFGCTRLDWRQHGCGGSSRKTTSAPRRPTTSGRWTRWRASPCSTARRPVGCA
jgi:hypothetical protein